MDPSSDPSGPRDPAVARDLAERGYAVSELLTAAEATALRLRWEELTRTSPPRWDGTGFASTADDPEQRFAEDSFLRAEIGPRVEAMFTGYAPFFAAFMAKRPGAHELGAHLDWSFSDERVRPAYHCWIALTATDADHGAIAFVPGSHLRVDFTRSRWDSHQDWADREFGADPQLLDVLEMSPGQIAIYDVRAIHLSCPHSDDAPRVAASCAMAHRDDVEDARAKLLDGLISVDGAS
jgi:hypothetical protein